MKNAPITDADFSDATTPPLEVLCEPERAAALLDPLRRKLVGALAEESDSAAGLARRLGESRQRLNYHLRALEDARLVELAEERRRGNCVERVLRVTARRFVVDPGALGELSADPDQLQDRFSSTFLIALAARAIRELAKLQDKAEDQEKRLASAALESRVRLPGPAEFEEFVEDLSRAVARVVAEHHAEDTTDGRDFRVLLGAYPAPSTTGDSPEGDRT